MNSGRLDSMWCEQSASDSERELGTRLESTVDFKLRDDALPARSIDDPHEAGDERLDDAVARTRDYLLAMQHDDGYWVGELQGDTILESEYILLLAYLGRENTDVARRAAAYILTQQTPEGGWSSYPGGPIEISGSVKAYFALKLTGHSPDADYMIRAREAILAAGGAERVNSFTRYYLALLGVISYAQCPAVPPELMLIPRWVPFNIYEMSAWSRTIVVPLSLLWAFQPSRELPEVLGIRELFVNSPEELPVSIDKSDVVDDMTRTTWVDWDQFFNRVDRCWKFLERLRIKPLRGIAVRRARRWMLKRLKHSDGLGAIFPPIIWSVVALKCLGYNDDSPEVAGQLAELDKLMIHDGETTRLEPCKSPVWDTAIATIALREAGVPRESASMKKAVKWLLSKEIRRRGDWAVLNPGHEPGGWCFEFNNEFYPDVDDASMVLMALARCLPDAAGTQWKADFLLGDWSPHDADGDAAAVVSGRMESDGVDMRTAVAEFESLTPQLTAMWRGLRWVLAMQGRDGGWGAFDPDNNRELFTRVPFADHNAMIDPSTADLTARMLEMFGRLNVPADTPAARRALDYVWKEQESDGAWYGRWGVNYIYGAWQALLGLEAAGVSSADNRVRRAVAWFEKMQQECGGWGESPDTYEDPTLRGQGPPTASQTAWAIMGLIAAGETESEAVRRGVDYLIDTQRNDGGWDEPWFTGTGFPRVFYLKYHLYAVYFPLMALARCRNRMGGT